MSPPESQENTADQAQNINKVAVVKSRELLQDNDRLIIEHLGQSYCLRLTRNNRLILTKS